MAEGDGFFFRRIHIDAEFLLFERLEESGLPGQGRRLFFVDLIQPGNSSVAVDVLCGECIGPICRLRGPPKGLRFESQAGEELIRRLLGLRGRDAKSERIAKLWRLNSQCEYAQGRDSERGVHCLSAEGEIRRELPDFSGPRLFGLSRSRTCCCVGYFGFAAELARRNVGRKGQKERDEIDPRGNGAGCDQVSVAGAEKEEGGVERVDAVMRDEGCENAETQHGPAPDEPHDPDFDASDEKRLVRVVCVAKSPDK